MDAGSDRADDPFGCRGELGVSGDGAEAGEGYGCERACRGRHAVLHLTRSHHERRRIAPGRVEAAAFVVGEELEQLPGDRQGLHSPARVAGELAETSAAVDQPRVIRGVAGHSGAPLAPGAQHSPICTP